MMPDLVDHDVADDSAEVFAGFASIIEGAAVGGYR
jgi:hypothetical protein